MSMPTVVGVGAATSGIGAITPAYPGGYTAVADDVAITFCECESTDTVTLPTNWGLMVAQSVTTGTVTKLSALWRRLTDAEAAPQIADAGNHLGARMIIVRGCVATGNPWDIAVGSTEIATDTTISIPTSSTSVIDTLVLAAIATGQDTVSTAGVTGWANANLANVAERMDNWVSAGTGGGFAMVTGEKGSAGPIGATTATLSLTANNKAHLLIALKGQATLAASKPPLPRSQFGALIQM